MLAKNGALADLIASGARILEVGCGACIGQGQSPSNDSITLRTFNRNFAGRSGTKGDKSYLISPETAIAATLTGCFTDPRELGIPYPDIEDVSMFLINDSMVINPPEDGSDVEIIRKPTIGNPPENGPLPEKIEGEVVIKVGDKITTDHIMPAGIYLKLRSNIPAYSQVVFECFTEPGKPSFAERAATVRDAGKHGIIVGGDSYGQGSSREHAAICPMFLGIKAVIAVAIERIHAANLVNFGIVPLIFANPADLEKIEEGQALEICDIRNQLAPGKNVTAKLADGSEIELTHTLSQDDIDIILAGGRLNI
jgi:aconitate hydratase